MPGTEGGTDTSEMGCMVDGDCVDVDTCSIDTCEDGACVHTPNADDPACVCEVAADCVQLPEDNECRTRTCVDNLCGIDFTPQDTALNETQQTAEDCQLVVCDGAGESESVADAADVPDDGRECTMDICDDGTPANVPLEGGTKCAAGECDDDGDCVGCTDPADCGGTSTFCEAVTCEGQVCGVDPTDAGTVVPDQTAGDCQVLECDGKGNEASIADDDDLPPSDGEDCTDDICTDGAPSHDPSAPNTSCDDDGGSFCDGGGACVECTSTPQCGGGNGCMIPACVDSECTLVADTGAPCDDGQFCSGPDTCNSNGACVGSGDPCPGPDNDSNCAESCNETTNSCTGLDGSGAACNDNLFCTANDTCNASGTCQGSGNPCPGHNSGSNCADSCSESANNCTANDTNHDCGSCRECENGSCELQCNPLQICCSGDDICISSGQSCP
jgi:hypothetical protein